MTGLLLDPGFTTPAMAAALAPAARVAAMCRFEAALARAEAAAGLVPDEAATAIAAACDAGVGDPDAVLAEGWEVGTPVVPLLDRLRAALPAAAVRWLHHGATTQDVVDTGLVLQAREGLALLAEDLAAAAAALRDLAVSHRDTVTAGWSFLQPAEATTVGRRAAGWLDPLVRHLTTLRDVDATLPVQLGGPTGTLAALGDRGPAVVEGVAAALGLAVPRLPWHTDRTVLAELAGLLGRVAATVGKIAADLVLLAQHGEVRMRAGGSSSMPHKRNPIDAIRAAAAAEACRGAAAMVIGARPHELERGVGGWHVEWLAVPLTLHTCAAAVAALRRAVATLEVDAAAVAAGVARLPDAAPGPSAGTFVDAVVAAHDRLRGA